MNILDGTVALEATLLPNDTEVLLLLDCNHGILRVCLGSESTSVLF